MRSLLLVFGLAVPAVVLGQLIQYDPRGGVPEEEEPILKERAVSFPAPPHEEALIAFDPGRPTSMRFYVDPASISVGDDGIVRYTMVVTGDEDTRNAMYEGLRCKTAERKTYGYGQRDGTWSEARDPQWEPVRYDAPRVTLYQDFLCPLNGPIYSVEEGIEGLRAGLNPRLRSLREY